MYNADSSRRNLVRLATCKVKIIFLFWQLGGLLSRWWKLKFTVFQIPQCNRNFITHNGIPYSKHRFYVLAPSLINELVSKIYFVRL
jgi:hypothetical protein